MNVFKGNAGIVVVVVEVVGEKNKLVLLDVGPLVFPIEVEKLGTLGLGIIVDIMVVVVALMLVLVLVIVLVIVLLLLLLVLVEVVVARDAKSFLNSFGTL